MKEMVCAVKEKINKLFGNMGQLYYNIFIECLSEAL